MILSDKVPLQPDPRIQLSSVRNELYNGFSEEAGRNPFCQFLNLRYVSSLWSDMSLGRGRQKE